ncbi:barstar family protein [Actinoplanes sp. TFC3]|uniref:barstar family protein n=1 Tax=Actinoplanes sp. TFC3 TaxID=1710355 RepID=UPI00082AB931|nr:barstar family protein [Actinoplanes sp. TFC3]
MELVIDGRNVLSEADLHHRLAGALGYGPFYRRDLDDLRDRLSAGDPRPVRLVWINAASLRMALGLTAYDTMVSTLERIATDDADRPWRQRFVFHILD